MRKGNQNQGGRGAHTVGWLVGWSVRDGQHCPSHVVVRACRFHHRFHHFKVQSSHKKTLNKRKRKRKERKERKHKFKEKESKNSKRKKKKTQFNQSISFASTETSKSTESRLCKQHSTEAENKGENGRKQKRKNKSKEITRTNFHLPINYELTPTPAFTSM